MKRQTFHAGIGRLLMIALGLVWIATASHAGMLEVEKDELKFGFIKLADCAPLVIAKELLFFEDEGLFVTLESQASCARRCPPEDPQRATQGCRRAGSRPR
jgi:ABC-type nitrate/sulfonate/bicarbonate transport system substrate-binding protein